MNKFQFIAALVSSLAWPLTILLIAIILRHPISKLLFSLRELQYKDFKAQFNEELIKVQDAADKSGVTEAQESPNAADEEAPAGDTESKIKALAKADPTSAVIFAWLQVEGELDDAVQRLGLQYGPERRRMTQGENIRVLKKVGAIDEETADSLMRLRDLRNKLAHNTLPVGGIEYAEAVEYGRLALRIAQSLATLRSGQ